MPRIITEEQVKVTNEIYEIHRKEYSIPEMINYMNLTLYYNSYSRCYETLSGDKSIDAEQYIKEQLNNLNKKYTVSREK